jgi:hypothetical protein
MKRRANLLVVALSSLLLVSCALVSPGRTITVPEVEQRLAHNLPVGSTRQEIETWLGSQGIEYHYENEPDPTYAWMPPRPEDCVPAYISAAVRCSEDWSFINGIIYMTFLLDADDRLIHTTVRGVYTGP